MEDVDHYNVLGLPSGEEGAKLTEKEISKAYKAKALNLHPDKRLDDPNAHRDFQKLKLSYEILKDEKSRKSFDDLLRLKREWHVRRSQKDAKRRKMVSDLGAREQAAFAPAREEEERNARVLRQQVARVRAEHASKGTPAARAPKPRTMASAQQSLEFDCLNILAGAGYKAYEDSVLKKLQRVAAA